MLFGHECGQNCGDSKARNYLNWGSFKMGREVVMSDLMSKSYSAPYFECR